MSTDTQLSDAELVRLCAEKVMGWVPGKNLPRDERDNIWLSSGIFMAWAYIESDGEDDDVARYHNRDAWDPLNNDADCMAVLDKMAADSLSVNIRTMKDGVRGWDVDVWGPEYPCSSRPMVKASVWIKGLLPANRRRAIVLAALRAVGVEV